MTAAVRFAAASSLPALLEEIARDGLARAAIDGATIKDGADLLAALGHALAFPAYYGQNWDAAEECLRDLGERYPKGCALFVDHARGLWQRQPRKMGVLTSVWLAASETAAVPLRLIFLLDGDRAPMA
jgi:hypothetical protein